MDQTDKEDNNRQTGTRALNRTYKLVEKLKKAATEGKVCAGKQRRSQCPVTQHYHVIFSFTDVLNQARPIWFSPQGVSFESFSSISRTRLYSNAIRQGIKGTSIICIAHLFPPTALKDCNLNKTIDITLLLFMEENPPGFCDCHEKLLRQLGEESIHLYFTLAAPLCNRWVQIIGWMVPCEIKHLCAILY